MRGQGFDLPGKVKRGYPVASAGSSRSGPGAGVEVEHPAAERPRPLPLVCYAFGADAAGYPRSGDHPYPGSACGGDPGARPAGGLVDLRYGCALEVNAYRSLLPMPGTDDG
jgi:hypothetical protein